MRCTRGNRVLLYLNITPEECSMLEGTSIDSMHWRYIACKPGNSLDFSSSDYSKACIGGMSAAGCFTCRFVCET